MRQLYCLFWRLIRHSIALYASGYCILPNCCWFSTVFIDWCTVLWLLPLYISTGEPVSPSCGSPGLSRLVPLNIGVGTFMSPGDDASPSFLPRRLGLASCELTYYLTSFLVAGSEGCKWRIICADRVYPYKSPLCPCILYLKWIEPLNL